jgi:hypothetical protein
MSAQKTIFVAESLFGERTVLPKVTLASSEQLDHFLDYVAKSCEALEDSVTDAISVYTASGKTVSNLSTKPQKHELEVLTVGLERTRRRSRIIGYLRLKARDRVIDPLLVIYRCDWNPRQPIFSALTIIRQGASVISLGLLDMLLPAFLFISLFTGVIVIFTGDRRAPNYLPIVTGIVLSFVFVVAFELRKQKTATEAEEEAQIMTTIWVQILSEYDPNSPLINTQQKTLEREIVD